MKLSVISAVALTAAMLASPAVFAQDTMAAPTMIGGQTVSAEDLPEVQAQCNTLAATELQSLATQDANKTDESEEPAGGDQALTAVDLELITIEECKAAGLAK